MAATLSLTSGCFAPILLSMVVRLVRISTSGSRSVPCEAMVNTIGAAVNLVCVLMVLAMECLGLASVVSQAGAASMP